MDDENNKCMHERFGTFYKSEEMNYGMLEVAKCCTQRWFSHLEKIEMGKMTKILHTSKVCARRRPLYSGRTVRTFKGWRE